MLLDNDHVARQRRQADRSKGQEGWEAAHEPTQDQLGHKSLLQPRGATRTPEGEKCFLRRGGLSARGGY
jgi:hypothetical protein